MIYGYARVSTYRQGKEGNSLTDQQAQLTAAGATEIVSDTYTGTKMDRPAFDELLNKLQSGDTLIVTKLDRFARTATDGATMIKTLLDRGVKVQVLNMGVIDNTPIGKLSMQVILAFAEFERDMIVERTQAGRAAAKAAGTMVDGRPHKFKTAQIDLAMQLLDNGESYTTVAQKTGISKATLVRARQKQKANNE